MSDKITTEQLDNLQFGRSLHDRPIPDDVIETACAAYAKATGYYVEFHRGLSSPSSDRMREGMRAALIAISVNTPNENMT